MIYVVLCKCLFIVRNIDSFLFHTTSNLLNKHELISLSLSIHFFLSQANIFFFYTEPAELAIAEFCLGYMDQVIEFHKFKVCKGCGGGEDIQICLSGYKIKKNFITEFLCCLHKQRNHFYIIYLSVCLSVHETLMCWPAYHVILRTLFVKNKNVQTRGKT